MFGLFENKNKYILVKTIKIPIQRVRDPNIIGDLYFYLYENRKGHRKEERMATNSFETDIKNIHDYYEKIYPWLEGQDFPDIPGYWDVVKEKRKDAIKKMYRRFFKS